MNRRRFIFDVTKGLMVPLVAPIVRGQIGILSSTPERFGPDTISNLAAWWRSDIISSLITTSGGSTVVSADGDRVGKWTDQVSGILLTNSNANNRGTYKVGIVNGRPVVRFDGTDDVLNVSSSDLLQNKAAVTVGVVVAVSGTGVGQRIFNASTNNSANPRATISAGSANVWVASARRLDGDVSNVTFTTTTSTNTSWHFLCVVFDYTNRDILYYVDGTEVDHANGDNIFPSPSGTSSSNTASNIVSVGGVATSLTAPASPLNGDLSEVIIWQKALSSTEVFSQWAYVKSKYALA